MIWDENVTLWDENVTLWDENVTLWDEKKNIIITMAQMPDKDICD